MSGIQLNWQPPTTNEDGTPVSNALIYAVYENDVKIIDDLAPAEFSIDMNGRASGDYTYQVTARYGNSAESGRSDSVVVNFIVTTSAPTNLTAVLI